MALPQNCCPFCPFLSSPMTLAWPALASPVLLLCFCPQLGKKAQRVGSPKLPWDTSAGLDTAPGTGLARSTLRQRAQAPCPCCRCSSC